MPEASAAAAWLARPVSVLRGIGPARAQALAASIGVRTVGELLELVPQRYTDPARSTLLAELVDGELARVAVRVLAASLWRRGGRTTLAVRIEDASGSAIATWINMPYLRQAFPAGRQVVLEGRASTRHGRRLYGARVVPADERTAGGLVPVYPEVPGLGGSQLRRLIAAAIAEAPPLPDPLPPALRHLAAVPDRDVALRHLHRPPDRDALDAARRRLAWEEVLALERRRHRETVVATTALPRRALDPRVWQRIEARLPFRLSDEQRSVLAQLRGDLTGGARIARLLHGEVGSGKTAVAFALALAFAAEGAQIALLAPTEILARQHLATFRRWLAGARVEVAGVLGDDPAPARLAAREAIASGRAAIAIGTHALLVPELCFHDLALVIFDEQHRFGVRQKASLLAKGSSPHVLTMTATPIPRTLAWARYGALEPCVLHARPGAGRVRTRLAALDEFPAWARAERDGLARGERLFLVVPRIDGPGGLLARAAALLGPDGPWSGLPAALVHGRLPGPEVEAEVDRFARREAVVLLGTTVVEVGLDLPAVPRMAVLDAHRLGLASLHQLRGRLARGPDGGEGECWLFADPAALPRLADLERHADGFAIAAADLAARGPGALRGLRQAGRSDFLLFDPVRDADLVEALRDPKVRSWLADGD